MGLSLSYPSDNADLQSARSSLQVGKPVRDWTEASGKRKRLAILGQEEFTSVGFTLQIYFKSYASIRIKLSCFVFCSCGGPYHLLKPSLLWNQATAAADRMMWHSG